MRVSSRAAGGYRGDMADHAVPNLPSRDLAATTAFYGRFGFAQTWRDDDWLILRRGVMDLEFFRHPELDPATSAFMCSIRVDDLDGLYRQILGAGVEEKATGRPRLHPIRTERWGGRVGFLVDIDGTQLHLIQND